LRLPRDAVTVPLVRTICRDAMSRLGVTPDCQGDVALALTEACTNVIQHAGGDENEYEVQIEFTGWICHIRVLDKGRGIDLRDSARTEAVLDKDSGRGIVLMRLMADRIAFESQPEDGTIVHLQKDLELEENALLAAL
jgi:serine/threonine-protein kinase RsbW